MAIKDEWREKGEFVASDGRRFGIIGMPSGSDRWCVRVEYVENEKIQTLIGMERYVGADAAREVARKDAEEYEQSLGASGDGMAR
ncbi:MAG: hypothetical protein M3008_08640 [Chloroflexota bacterium]|nr:hypothetical protein [Chloroflexota bacterium]